MLTRSYPKPARTEPAPRDPVEAVARLGSEASPDLIDDLGALLGQWLDEGRYRRDADLGQLLGWPAIPGAVDPAARRLELLRSLAEPFDGLGVRDRARTIEKLARRHAARNRPPASPLEVALSELQFLAKQHPRLRWPLGWRRIVDLLQ